MWDFFGRLTKVFRVVDPETTSLIARYRYDALNRRVERYVDAPSNPPGVSDGTTWYIYDGWRAIEERGIINTDQKIVRARYGFGLGLDEVLWMDRDTAMTDGAPDPNGVLDHVIEARYFVHHDLKGSAVAVTDDVIPGEVTPEEVEVIERFTYSAYGEVTAWWDPTWNEGYDPMESAGLSRVGLPYLYTGQRFDTESGLHYFKHRSYDPQSGRFLRRDLIGYADGPGLYQYAQSNPSTWTDPHGLYVRNITVASDADVSPARSQFMLLVVTFANMDVAAVDESFLDDAHWAQGASMSEPIDLVLDDSIHYKDGSDVEAIQHPDNETAQRFGWRISSNDPYLRGPGKKKWVITLPTGGTEDFNELWQWTTTRLVHEFTEMTAKLRDHIKGKVPHYEHALPAEEKWIDLLKQRGWISYGEHFRESSIVVTARFDPLAFDFRSSLLRLDLFNKSFEMLMEGGEISPEDAARLKHAAYWDHAQGMMYSSSPFAKRVALGGPTGFLQQSLQGSRVLGGKIETFCNGVRSIDGGGFAGMDDYGDNVLEHKRRLYATYTSPF